MTPAALQALRNRLGLSQAEFAQRYHIPIDTLRQWEYGRRRGDSAADTLLTLITREPELIAEILARPNEGKA